jgi:protein TonB
VTGRAVAGVVAPQPTERAAPSYPEPARLAGVQGTVVLRARVTVEGAVGEVVIDRSAGNADLDAAAVEALRRWRFEPARRAGRPVEVWIVIPIHFSLG